MCKQCPAMEDVLSKMKERIESYGLSIETGYSMVYPIYDKSGENQIAIRFSIETINYHDGMAVIGIYHHLKLGGNIPSNLSINYVKIHPRRFIIEMATV